MMKRALITGVTGQDGSYLACLLLKKGYHVHGTIRDESLASVARLEELNIAKDVDLISVGLADLTKTVRMIDHVRPDEIYNLAAQQPQTAAPTGVRMACSNGDREPEPLYTSDVNGLGAARLLEAIHIVNPKICFYQASSSEMFGNVLETPQGEGTPFNPRNPYAIAKLYAHWMTSYYREKHGIHASSGILFNHESVLRGQEFVTRKITVTLAKIKHGEHDILRIGNLSARRDWGFAADYVCGMWLMLQQSIGNDYVLATGEGRSVRDFVTIAALVFGFDLVFEGAGINERGIDRKTGRTIIKVDPQYYRPTEVNELRGNPCKAEQALGWRRETAFPQLVALMAEADDRRVRDGRLRF